MVFAHFKEVAFLFHLLYRTMAVGAAMVFIKLTLQPIGFAGHAVQALVVFLIDIALLINFLQCILNYLVMTLLTGADKVIVGDIQLFPQQLEVGNNRIYILNRGYTFSLALRWIFRPCFITAGQEEYILTLSGGGSVPGCQR